jgi:hypothetical protein
MSWLKFPSGWTGTLRLTITLAVPSRFTFSHTAGSTFEALLSCATPIPTRPVNAIDVKKEPLMSSSLLPPLLSRCHFYAGYDKRDVNLFLDLDHPSLPFGFKIGKIVKYTGPNSDQLDLVLGKNLARMLRIQPKPSAPKIMEIRQI